MQIWLQHLHKQLHLKAETTNHTFLDYAIQNDINSANVMSDWISGYQKMQTEWWMAIYFMDPIQELKVVMPKTADLEIVMSFWKEWKEGASYHASFSYGAAWTKWT